MTERNRQRVQRKVLLEKEPELRADMFQGESVPICCTIIGTLRV